jgi:uncharacterized phage infection (PIP) family protein YhgE
MIMQDNEILQLMTLIRDCIISLDKRLEKLEQSINFEENWKQKNLSYWKPATEDYINKIGILKNHIEDLNKTLNVLGDKKALLEDFQISEELIKIYKIFLHEIHHCCN